MRIWANFLYIYNSLTVFEVFPASHFGSFYPQNLVSDPQKLGARVRSDAYYGQSKIIFIYLWILILMYFWFERQLRIIDILGVVLISLKQQPPEP